MVLQVPGIRYFQRLVVLVGGGKVKSVDGKKATDGGGGIVGFILWGCCLIKQYWELDPDEL